jgi:hypothetical protein
MAAMSLTFELSKQTSSLITAHLPSHLKFARLRKNAASACFIVNFLKDF